MQNLITPHVKRFPGLNEFVTISSQMLSFKKPRTGWLKDKNHHGLGIVISDERDREIENIEENKVYAIDLHFKHQAVEASLEPFIRRESGLYVFTFIGICRHVTLNFLHNIVVAGFEITDNIPKPVQEFLKKNYAANEN